MLGTESRGPESRRMRPAPAQTKRSKPSAEVVKAAIFSIGVNSPMFQGRKRTCHPSNDGDGRSVTAKTSHKTYPMV